MATLEEIKAALEERGSTLPKTFVKKLGSTTPTQSPQEDIDSLMERANVIDVMGKTSVTNPEDFTEDQLKLVTERVLQEASEQAGVRGKRARDMGITAADSAVLNAGTGVAKLFGLEGLEDTLRESRSNLSTGDRIASDIAGSLLPGALVAKLLTRGGKSLTLGRAAGAAAIEGGASSTNLSEEDTVLGQLGDGVAGAAIGAGTVGVIGGAGKLAKSAPDVLKKSFNTGASKSDTIQQKGLSQREEIGSALESARKSITGSSEVNNQVKKLVNGPSGVAILKDLKQEFIEFAENNFSDRVFKLAEKQELKPKDIFYDRARGTLSVIKAGAKKSEDGYSAEDLVEIPMSGEAFATARAKIEDKVSRGFFTQKTASGRIKSFSDADKAALGENAGLVTQYAENEQALTLLKRATAIAKKQNPSEVEVTNFLKTALEETPNMNALDRYKVAMSAFANREGVKSFKPSKEFKETITSSGLNPTQQKDFQRLITDMSRSNGFSAQEFAGEAAKNMTYRAVLGSASLMYRLSIARSIVNSISKLMPNANKAARNRIGNELLSGFDNLSEGERQRLMLNAVDEYSPDIIDKQAEQFVKSLIGGIGVNSAVLQE